MGITAITFVAGVKVVESPVDVSALSLIHPCDASFVEFFKERERSQDCCFFFSIP